MTAPNEKFVAFDEPQTRAFADAFAVCLDLGKAIELSEALLASEDGSDSLAVEALFIAALTLYGRAFSTGARHGYKAQQAADRLPSQLAESHRYFLDLRNKWIAHSVNDFERTQVAIALTEEGSSWRVRNVLATVDQTGPLVFKMDEFKDLCGALLVLIWADRDAEAKRVEQLARALPQHDLAKLPQISFHSPDLARADRPRTQHTATSRPKA